MTRKLHSASPLTRDRRDETIAVLQVELERTRRALLNALPEQSRALLFSYADCEAIERRHAWVSTTAATIISMAVPRRESTHELMPSRSSCPLCGGEGTSAGGDGFAVPEGLRRHLVGHGSQVRCPFMEAAERLAHAYWARQFGAMDAARDMEALAETARRLGAEVVYQIIPGEPGLLNDDLPSSARPRTADRLLWATRRLTELGFAANEDNRTVSFTRRYGSNLIFADPRHAGRLIFRMYRAEAIASVGVPRAAVDAIALFDLRDSSIRDIQSKFRRSASKAVAQARSAMQKQNPHRPGARHDP